MCISMDAEVFPLYILSACPRVIPFNKHVSKKLVRGASAAALETLFSCSY